MKEDDLTIAADSLIMIYIFIILRSKVFECFSQIKFVNEFLTPYVKNSKLGYCITTLEVAVTHINSLTRDELISTPHLQGSGSESDAFFH